MDWLKRVFRWAPPVPVPSENGYRPLELVGTDDLIAELARRYQACAFIAQTPTAEHDLQETCHFYGPERIIQGLAMSLVIKAQANIVQRSHRSMY